MSRSAEKKRAAREHNERLERARTTKELARVTASNRMYRGHIGWDADGCVIVEAPQRSAMGKLAALYGLAMGLAGDSLMPTRRSGRRGP